MDLYYFALNGFELLIVMHVCTYITQRKCDLDELKETFATAKLSFPHGGWCYIHAYILIFNYIC